MKNKEEKIVLRSKPNFETLKRAFLNDDVALVECTEKESGKKVAVICTVEMGPSPDSGEPEYTMVPFARMFEENPYDQLIPPFQEGGHGG